MADADAAAPPAPNGGSFVEATKGSKCFKLYPDAAAAYNSLANGPVAKNVKDQTTKTSSEFSNLAAARRTPSTPAATGQPLTHYHSLFSETLSWNNPRASAITYVSIVTLIVAARYLDIIRWGFKLTWMVLACTVAAEVVGKLVIKNGLASQLRPRKYYMVPRETFDSLVGDVHELVNFFVIEAQRIMFAENVTASAVACVAAFISYYLVKIVPYWGLALIGTTMVFFVPLVYTSNQELIDHHLKQASDIVNAQTTQLQELASKHTAQATEITKQYVGDYTAKAQQMLRGRSTSPEATKGSNLKETDFPKVPTTEPKSAEPAAKAEEPAVAS